MDEHGNPLPMNTERPGSAPAQGYGLGPMATAEQRVATGIARENVKA